MKEMKELEREIEQRKELRILKNLKKNKKTNKQLLNWNEWLAGLIDGAGSFTLNKAGYANLEIVMELREVDCLAEIKQRFGGTIKTRAGLKAVRYRAHSLVGICQIIACVNGHIRIPRRQIQLEKICKHYNITYKYPTKLTSENGWISGFFDATGTIQLKGLILRENRYIDYQLMLIFKEKVNTMLNEIQECFGGNLKIDQSSGGSFTLSYKSQQQLLDFYDYFKKYPARSSKKHNILLIPQLYDIQNELNYIKNVELKQKICNQFISKWYFSDKEFYENEISDGQERKEQNQFRWNSWLAGLLDSCGNIMLSKTYVYGKIEIKLQRQDHECFENIKIKYGGSVKVCRTGIRYRLKHQEGLKNLLEDINGHLRIPVRIYQVQELCKKNNIELKQPDNTIRLDNAWISGFFDGIGSIVINQTTLENKKQLVIIFNQKTNQILLTLQQLFGGKIYINTNKQSGMYKYALYFTKKEEILQLYAYFKKFPSRSDKNKRILLIAQYYDMQTLMLSITDNQLHETLWKKFLCQWDYKAIDEIHSGEILKQKAKLKKTKVKKAPQLLEKDCNKDRVQKASRS
ncbi:hypothetical protein ACTFIU_002000 [Dictyostelium citrinum]